MATNNQAYPSRISDQQLGNQLSGLIAQQAASQLPYSVIFSQLLDLVGDDTSLLGPLRDLLGRPAFQQLVGLKDHSVQVGVRDALLHDLGLTYNAGMVGRLAVVINGCLGLPPSLMSPAVQKSAYGNPPPSWSPTTPNSSQQPSSGVSQSNPSTAASAQHQVSRPASSDTKTSILSALVAMLSGAVLVGLAWMFFGDRLKPGGEAPSLLTTIRKTPQPGETLDIAATPKDTSPVTPVTSQGAWGNATDYKFGQLPGGDYPQSCAFSSTDPNGRMITDKSQMEFWACRDVGGDKENGYKVAWADGKETIYSFGPSGEGAVVGTNGSRYPIRWRNDTHQSDEIIVINHQDGAVSWVPGNVR